tara:strand:+ start:777 stop:2345 length:1569 start_codon:yes stop_codon:yes gene_type:complete
VSKVRLNGDQVGAIKNLCKQRFKYFCQTMMPPEWFDPLFHGPLCDFMQDTPCEDRLVVMARSHLKTTIAATFYPLWKTVVNPNLRTLVVSNSLTNAEKTIHTIKGIVESNRTFHLLFPELIPQFDKVRWSDRCACIKRDQEYPEGSFEAAGIGSSIIRRHFDLIIQDDTVAPKKDELSGEELLPSRDEIEKAIGFHKLTLPLLVDVASGMRIVIGTRWAFYDLINHIKEEAQVEGGRFAVYDVPAIDPTTNNPNYKRFTPKTLESIRRDMGQYMFSALYLNQPVASSQMKFRPEWINYFEEKDLPKEGICTITVDPADPPTGKSSQDYSVALSGFMSKEGLFVKRYRRGRMTHAEIINAALDLADQDNALRIRIEKNRYPELAAGMRVEMARRNKHYIVEEVRSQGANAKAGRVMKLQPIAENGLLHIRKGMGELEHELYQFPMGKHDDIIDALGWQIDEGFQVPDYEFAQPAKEMPKGNVFSFNQIMKSTDPPMTHAYSMIGATGTDESRWDGDPLTGGYV